MTSTPDTPNMTDAPRITEKHIEILEWVRTTEKWAPFVVDRLTDVEMLVRSIHEGSVVVVSSERNYLLQAILNWARADYDTHERDCTCVLCDAINKLEGGTDTTDATTQEAE